MAVGQKLLRSNDRTIRKNKDGVKCRMNLLKYLETVALRNLSYFMM